MCTFENLNHIMASKNYCLEHTKLLFAEQKIMNPENLHMYHTFSSSISITINISKAFQTCAAIGKAYIENISNPFVTRNYFNWPKSFSEIIFAAAGLLSA